MGGGCKSLLKIALNCWRHCVDTQFALGLSSRSRSGLEMGVGWASGAGTLERKEDKLLWDRSYGGDLLQC